MHYKISSENHIFSFTKDNRPVLFVKDGDEVEIETLDCFSNQIKSNEDKLEQMDWNKVNPAITALNYVKSWDLLIPALYEFFEFL